MIYKTFEVALELKQTSTNPIFTVVEGDTGNRLKISVTDGGSPVDLRDCRILAVFSKTNGIAVQDSGGEGNTGIDIGGTYHNEVTVSIFPASIAPGNVECELQIYSGNNNEVLITTARFNFECNRAVMNGDVLQSTEEFPLLVNLISTVQGFVLAEEERQAEYNKWLNAEAEVESVPLGEPAYVNITEEDGKKKFTFGIPGGEGAGDMLKSVYDKNNDGIVDTAEDAQRLGGKTADSFCPAFRKRLHTLGAPSTQGTFGGWTIGWTSVGGEPHITEDSVGFVRIAQGATSEQFNAFCDARIRVVRQSENSLTLNYTGEMPTIDIPVEVIWV